LYREKLLLWDQTRYGMPLLGESLVLCSRVGQPPATWEELVRQVEERGKGGPCLPALTTPEALEREFYSIAACYARRAVPVDGQQAHASRDHLLSSHNDAKTCNRVGAGPAAGEARRVRRGREPYRLKPVPPSSAAALGSVGWHGAARSVAAEQAFASGQVAYC